MLGLGFICPDAISQPTSRSLGNFKSRWAARGPPRLVRRACLFRSIDSAALIERQCSGVNAFLTPAATRHNYLPDDLRGNPRVDNIVAVTKAAMQKWPTLRVSPSAYAEGGAFFIARALPKFLKNTLKWLTGRTRGG